MHHQHAFTAQRFMDVFTVHFQVAEADAPDLAELLVVIAGHIDDARAVLGLAEDGAQYVAVRLRPVEAAAQAPDIDDVADQNQLVGLNPAQEIQYQVGAAVARTQMDIGDECGAYLNRRSRARLHVKPLWILEPGS